MSVNVLAALLLAVATIVAGIGPVIEAGGRGPEGVVRTYLAAVEREDLEAALAELEPEVREDARGRVELQLGTRYQLDALVLGAPSAIARLGGASADRAWASLSAQVTPVSGERWKSTGVVGLVQRGGRWYLVDPPFA